MLAQEQPAVAFESGLQTIHKSLIVRAIRFFICFIDLVRISYRIQSQDRGLTPYETLALMGLHGRFLHFKQAIDKGVLNASDVRALAGNGFHCAAVGAILLWGVGSLRYVPL